MLTLILIFAGESALGQPQPASIHTASKPPPAIARTSTTALDAALEMLPEHTAFALVIPDPRGLHARLSQATEGIAPLLEEWAPDRLEARVRRAMALEDDGPAAGIDPRKPLILVPGFSGAPDLVRLTLSSVTRFEAWARTRGPAGAIAPWNDGPVYAIAATDGTPMACAPRGDGVWCQLGAAEGPDPLLELRRMIDVPSRRLAHVEGMERAAIRLRADADAYVVARPTALGELAARAHYERARRASPFSQRRGTDEDDLRRDASPWVARAALVNGAAAALTVGNRAIESEVELVLSARGAALVRAMTADVGRSDPLSAWARTPALAHLVVRLDPAFSAEILRSMDVTLPPDILSGTLAAMALGIDTECGAAKAAKAGWAASWPFVFPMAGAIGLAGGRPLDRDRLMNALGVARDKKHDGDDDVLFRARTSGGPIEGRLVSGALLVGTGPGSGAAARRRWSAGTDATPSTGAFIEAEASLPAIAAALASGSYEHDTRPELRRLDALMRALRPWSQRYPRVRLEAKSIDSGARVRVVGSFSQP